MKQNLPQPWRESAKTRQFFEMVAAAPGSLLMLDYDGTLAPFTPDRLQARPYPGVRERLEQLQQTVQVRVAMISGRKAAELQSLLALAQPVEIWGSHGREHLAADGRASIEPLTSCEQRALDGLKVQMEREFGAAMLECKPNSVAVHWRGAEASAQQVTVKMETLYHELAALNPDEGRLQLLRFDGGLEARAGSINKGDAVRRLLEHLPDGTPAAFLGDDQTDEDAFRELTGERHLAVLVGSAPRQSAACSWLRAPEEMLQFLDMWIEAAGRSLPRAQATGRTAGGEAGRA